MSINKYIKASLHPACSLCGKRMNVLLYNDRSYRGGHYFGRFPIHNKRDLKKVVQGPTKPAIIGGHTYQVLSRDPKIDRYAEYWECPRCYWKG